VIAVQIYKVTGSIKQEKSSEMNDKVKPSLAFSVLSKLNLFNVITKVVFIVSYKCLPSII